jgi:MoxR-like ATPases
MRSFQVAEALRVAIGVQRPIFIWGPPGVGKSDVVQQVATEGGSEMRDVRLNLMDPTDIKGFPVPDMETGVMRWLPADFLPPMVVKKEMQISAKKTEMQLVENDSRGVLFLDELNQAPPMTQTAAYQLLLNRKVGNYTLPKNWAMVAAGNRESDRSNAQRMPAALALRLIHIDFDVNVDDWCTWALDQGDRVPVELLSFIRFRPELIHAFDPKQRVSPNPRSWVFCGETTNKQMSPEVEFEMFKGTVGEAAAIEYKGFLQIHRELPSVDSILLDPDNTPVPTKPAVLFAIGAALAAKTTKDNFPRFMKYMERVGPEWLVTYVRDAQTRTKREICTTREFLKFATTHGHLLS